MEVSYLFYTSIHDTYSYQRYDGVPGTYVDIVRDVINIVSVHWAADRLVGPSSLQC